MRRARDEGATLNLISGVLAGGRRLSIPPSGRIARSEAVPGTVRRRADLKRALLRLGVPEESISQIVRDLTGIRAATSTGRRTVVTADIIARLTQVHRLGVAPEQVLEASVQAVASVPTLVHKIHEILPAENEQLSGPAAVELVAGLIGAVLRDSLIAQLSSTEPDPETEVDITDRLPEDHLNVTQLNSGSSHGDEEFEFDRSTQG